MLRIPPVSCFRARGQRSIADALKDVSPNVREEALKAVGLARVHAAVEQAQRGTMQREAETLGSGIQTLQKRLDTLRAEMRRADDIDRDAPSR